jgi:hypothetical protein
MQQFDLVSARFYPDVATKSLSGFDFSRRHRTYHERVPVTNVSSCKRHFLRAKIAACAKGPAIGTFGRCADNHDRPVVVRLPGIARRAVRGVQLREVRRAIGVGGGPAQVRRGFDRRFSLR